MNIKLLTNEDWSAFKSLRLESLRLHPEAFSSSLKDESLMADETFQASLTKNDIFGAFINGQLIGCVGFFVFSPQKMRHKGAIFAMYIQPSYRKKGIAEMLLKAVIAHASQHVTQLHLTVVTTNQVALNLYQKNGFKIYGTEPNALKIDDQFYAEHLMVLEF